MTSPGSESIAFPSRAAATPKTIGRYEVVGTLGQGGMAAVYLARARGPAGFQKLFAIKTIHAHLASDRQFATMFLDEARIAAALHHPNIAHVFELGEDHGSYFLAMEYLLGEHLGALERQLGQRGRAAPIEVMTRIVALAAEGLHHAHEATDELGQPLHVVHRDVSPQNIFVTYAGHVKMTDFGVAKATSNEVRTDTGTVKGKFAYMAPEQALGRGVDRRTDVFALGVVLWEAITLRRLFRSPTDAETLLKVTQCEVPAPSTIRPEIPAELDRIVLRCLAREPAERFATAAELAHELDAFLATRDRVAPAAIGALMSELFASEIAKRQAEARQALSREVSLSGETSASSPEPAAIDEDTISHSQSRPVSAPAEITNTPPLPLVPLRRDVLAAPDSEPPPRAPALEIARRSRLGVVLAGLLVAGGSLAFAVWWARGAPARSVDTRVTTSSTAAPPPTTTATTTPPVTTTTPPVTTTPPATTTTPPVTTTTPPATPTTPPVRTTTPPVTTTTPPVTTTPPPVTTTPPATTPPVVTRHRAAQAPATPFLVEINCRPAAEVLYGNVHDTTPFIGEVPPGVRITLRNERGERVVRPVPGPDGTAQIPPSLCP
ncbi:MAG: serine/threonine protein kinase [Sandaracinaceae bacterium]|nr:serine/threonine protein kinase [Sandaracinaceae bacterium]